MKMSEIDPEEQLRKHVQFLTSEEAMYLIRIALANTIKDFFKKGMNPDDRELKGMRTLLGLFNEMQAVGDVQRENLESRSVKKNKKTWNKLLSDIDIPDK